jgi:hypothetical protein
VNVADLSQLVDVANVMRSNGIARAAFATDGSVTECELNAKYMPPPEADKPLTPEDMAVARDQAKKDAAAFELAQSRLLFLASEGVPDDELSP